ncbi:MAG TPA: TerC family protein [Verrucomicrobiae bacterium]|nr:TerC family protein [Verrucomicrobiae bacterium]
MTVPVEITPWHWMGFILCVLFFLALDLGVFHRGAHVVKFKEALAWTALWFALAMLFAGALAYGRGREEAVQFTTGYLIELSLSLDNVLVIALIFAWFHVPPAFQHRLLFLGILGALVMRGIMIAVGVALIHEFAWVLYVFGAFLVFAGVKMLFAGEKMVRPEKNLVLRLARKLFPVTPDFAGGKLFARLDGRFALTPLALVLLLVETTDLIFALDSVPAVFSVTRKAFIVFTSNVFAILGLRSLYFLLAGAIGYFRYLKIGLSLVLVFIGVKMLVEPHGRSPQWFQMQIPTATSLLVVALILFVAIAWSVVAARRERKAAR